MADQFPDLDRIRVEKQLASKEWANCKKCDWFYRKAVLPSCPMCHHEWKKHLSYEQPPYEAPDFN